MKILYKKWVKICAFLLCILSFNAAAVSLAGMLFAEEEGIYGTSREEYRKEVFAQICSKYSVAVMARHSDGFGRKEFKDTNFRYGVIQADSIDQLDVNDKDQYVVCNFDKNVQKKDLIVESFCIGEHTRFRGESTLSGNITMYQEHDIDEREIMVEGCYYTPDTDEIYLMAEGKLYRAFWEVYPLNEFLLRQTNADGSTTYGWRSNEYVSIEGQNWYLNEIEILKKKNLQKMGTIVSDVPEDDNYEEYEISEGVIRIYSDLSSEGENYYVLSYVNEPLTENGNFLNQNLFVQADAFHKQDLFVQAEALIDLAYGVRDGLFFVFLCSAAVCVASFAALLIGAGRKKGGELSSGWTEKIPLDLYLLTVVCVGGILISLAASGFLGALHLLLAIQFGILILLISEVLFLAVCVTISVRIKLGHWWKNTICWRILHWIRQTACRNMKRFGKAVPMLWKAWMIMAAVAVLELFGLLATSYQPEMQLLLWFLEKIVLYALISVVLLQMRKLKEAGKKLSDGELENRLETDRMFWDLKEHGENLNHIQEGMHRAVLERLKSERFKTELITNVSHDIKTPLTSIINYVDLLEKEETGNDRVREYLEVLSRQSARLKKLIEDLMEASKASTGNLNVLYESCDARVMLTQTIGEFEEKLKAGQIELIVQENGAPLLIQADPRHLWRIFDNLMNNICKYAQPCTRAYVNIQTNRRSVCIIFRNISKYALNIDSEELMERFVRGDSSRNTEGSGLGLSIAKSLTELMQGSFELVVDGDLFKVLVSFPAMEESGAEKFPADN